MDRIYRSVLGNRRAATAGAAILAVAGLVNAAYAGDPAAPADVIGRPLNIRGAGWLGHVGIWTGGDVLEVLNVKNRVVQRNSLHTFKAQTSGYWGARYGVGAAQAARIIAAGWDQRRYNNTYSVSGHTQPGASIVHCTLWRGRTCVKKFEQIFPGALRCDTFVNWAFQQGTGQPLVTGAVLPIYVFEAQSFTR